jgi:hypothetical protein
MKLEENSNLVECYAMPIDQSERRNTTEYLNLYQYHCLSHKFIAEININCHALKVKITLKLT